MTSLGARLKRARDSAGLSQSALARAIGVKPQSIQAIESGRVRRSAYVAEMARVLGVSAVWLAEGRGPMKNGRDGRPQGQPIEQAEEPSKEAVVTGYLEPRDHKDLIPVLAVARGGEDQEMFVDDGPIDYIPRPAVLKGVQRAYAMQIVGDSMVPMYRPGLTVHVNPFRRPAPGRGVVVWKTNKAILVKEFVRRTPEFLVLLEYCPERREIVIPVADVMEVHTIVGTEEP